MASVDITGKRYHPLSRLNPLYPTRKLRGSSRIWMCKCDCGKLVEISCQKIRSCQTKSCGCYRREQCANVGRSTRKPRQAAEIIKYRKLGFTYKALGRMFKLTYQRVHRIVSFYSPDLRVQRYQNGDPRMRKK